MVCQLFSLLLVHLLFVKSGSSMMDHIIQESAIYASHSKDGDNIAWSKDPDWSNLDNILKDNGMTEIAELCVQGTWLLYEKADYVVTEKTGTKMMSGAYNCAPKPGTVMSMQPFGSEGVMEYSLTLFNEKYFGAKAFPLSTDTTRTTMDLFYGSLRSLIVVGNEGWAITMEIADASVVTICLKPGPVKAMATMPICSLQNVEYTPLEPNIKILYVHKGCSEEPAGLTMTLTDCKPFEDQDQGDMVPETGGGDNMKETPTARQVGGGGAKDTLLCKGGTPNEELGVLLRFLKLRRENDFRKEPVISWTNSNEKTWKTEIADMTFNIAMASCPDVAVSSEFLQMTRESFMFELIEAWNKVPPQVEDKEVETIITQLQKCLYISNKGASAVMRSMTMNHYIESTPFTESASIHPNLMWNATNNLAIDIAWIMANLVASHCHSAFQYQNNFWYNYIRMFTELYLEPLAKSTNWKNGPASRQRHNYFLSGFGIDFQLAGIALCASNAVRLNPNMEPFQRPLLL